LRFILSNPCFLPHLVIGSCEDEVARIGENLPTNTRLSDARSREAEQGEGVSWGSHRRQVLPLAAVAGAAAGMVAPRLYAADLWVNP
jgi:hypothetical protein